MKKALHESGERCWVLFEKNTQGILTIDLETGRFDYANPSLCRMFGYPVEELLSLRIEDLHPKDLLDQVTAEFELNRRGEEKLAFDLPCRRKDGTVFYADVNTTGCTIDGREYAVGFFKDVTERKQTEEKIRSLNKELQDRVRELVEAKSLEERANRAKIEFLSNISHELSTPLNSVIGFSQVLLTRNFGDLNERQQVYAENILNSGEQLHATLANIVSFVSMDVSNPDMVWEDFRLKDIVDFSVSAIRKAAEDRCLALTLDVEKEADRMIRADKGKIVQVFHNLLSNAVKFSRDGGQIALHVRNRQGSEESGEEDFMEVTIEDTGIGIGDEDLPRLFQPFGQLEAPLTKRFKGVGMGLVLTRKLVEAHGGTVRVESNQGKGSRFIFTIPVRGKQRGLSRGMQDEG